MRSKSKRFYWVVSSILFSLILLSTVFIYSSASNHSFGVKPDDSWTFIVKKASRYFKYSTGLFDVISSTEGYRLGDDLVPEKEKIIMTVLSTNKTNLEITTYQLSWGNTSVIANSSETLFEYGIQESLGRGVLGTGYEFLLSNSGVTIGDWVFLVPVDKLLSSPLQIWNQSTLPGALEGMETILKLDDADNEHDYHMWIRYEGNMTNIEEEISLQFDFSASFRWEKDTGVLLTYEIITSMEGSYKQSHNAEFALNLELERTDLDKILGKTTPGFDLFMIFFGFILLIIVRTYLRRIP
ncbi:MAG: hypothetical protein ACFFB5_10625 [Promethearchaeota archaeon]